jgi:predicted TIM-barrel fold metal-dependent hydrolase
MRGECIIDMYAHVYRTAEIGRQAMQGRACPQRWEGVIDELRATMHDAGIWRAVIAPITPTQTMREKALALLPPDLSQQSRQKAEAEVRERMLQRMDHNNLWGCEVGRTYPEFLPFINLDPILMDAVTVRQKVRDTVSKGARGIILLPGLHGFYGNDRRVWPIYEMAQSFQLPILSQTGDAGPLPPGGRGHWGRPRYFGDVAASFPKLRLILGHLGKGYESEIAVLTRRYPNVYTETSMPGSGHLPRRLPGAASSVSIAFSSAPNGPCSTLNKTLAPSVSCPLPRKRSARSSGKTPSEPCSYKEWCILYAGAEGRLSRLHQPTDG